MRHISRVVRLFVFILLLAALLAPCTADVAAQAADEHSVEIAQSRMETEEQEQLNPAVRDFKRQQAKALNKQRHEELRRDTDKLLQLATELKLDVDKSNEQTLSLEVIKKAEQIEKLSKIVQKKMRGY